MAGTYDFTAQGPFGMHEDKTQERKNCQQTALPYEPVNRTIKKVTGPYHANYKIRFVAKLFWHRVILEKQFHFHEHLVIYLFLLPPRSTRFLLRPLITYYQLLYSL